MPIDPATDTFTALLIRSKTELAQDIYALELVDPAGARLAPFDAGAHITLETPSGARRDYSLTNDPSESHRYVLGIKAERRGRGGSVSLLDNLAAGDRINVSPPQNDFALVEAPEYLFIAGGIGITPIMAMLRYLQRTGMDHYRLIYCTRSPEHTAFRDELCGPDFAGHVTLHHDNGDPEQLFDLWPLLEKPTRAQVYCCGPRPLLDEVRDMSGHWPQSSIHFEDFGSDVQALKPDDSAFTVRHADTGDVVEIPAGATILETLRKHGYRLPSSCESGTCGTCKTLLISGAVEHRDLVLSDAEKTDHIMICVSRARDGGGELVLKW
jgi:phthalate 4,5-dioxygenase reductase subunit